MNPLLSIWLAGCGPAGRPDDTDPVDTGDTGVPLSYADIEHDYETDSDSYLAEDTPQNILDAILEGLVADVPPIVLENTQAGYLDCDDTDPALNPETPWYEDRDGDGYGNAAAVQVSCEQLPGFVADSSDADDRDATVNPGAPEICDELDNNQDGNVDEDLPLNTFYADSDGDTYGNSSAAVSTCQASYPSYVSDSSDCNDSDATIHANQTYYVDADTDGYGSAATGTACASSPPSGYASNAEDCDDTESAVNPGASEVQNNNKDDDCDPSTIYLLEGDYSLADANFQGSATTSYASIGWSYATADIDGDGYDELLTGAPQTAGTSGGGVYVFPSSASGLTTSGYAYMYGVTAGDWAGYSLANAGDMDGDGKEDVLVGAVNESTNGSYAGAVYLVSGANVATDYLDGVASAVMYGDSAEYYAGIDLAGGGDVDDDGTPDLLIGAYGREPYGIYARGAAYLIYGPTSSDFDLDSGADVRIDGSDSADMTGTGLSLGNVDGDSYDDVLVGSYNANSGVGRADVFLGPVASGTLDTDDSDVRIDGDPTYGDVFGKIGTIEGDVDGDGKGDIIACDYRESSVAAENGSCYLFLGSATLSGTLTAGADEDTRWMGPEEGTWLGISVATGDYNGDTINDVLIGANGGNSSTWIGGAYLYYGPITVASLRATDADAFFEGEDRGDLAGSAVGAGDHNGDGFDDVSVGAPYYDGSRTETGRTYTFYGTGM